MKLRLWFVAALAAAPAAGGENLDERPQPWRRLDEPILSAQTTKQDWAKVVCYSPHVIHHDGKFRMWYLGTSEASRTNDMAMGNAESDDGLTWREHPDNPIIAGADIPWGRTVQTPFVLFDNEAELYKMWFVSGDGVTRDDQNKIIRNDQKLGYATSEDGLNWEVRPEPVFPSGRSHCVIKEGPDKYRMWMGSRPDLTDDASAELYRNIYHFRSTDGVNWMRSEDPVLRPTGRATTVVYPFVIRDGVGYRIWYGCHLATKTFEIFSADSTDGLSWRVDHERPAFPAAPGESRFDSRYTSTPCVVAMPDRYLIYYSARNWKREYRAGDGQIRRDGAGVYSSIGVAILDRD